jgi:hypothetical protein
MLDELVSVAEAAGGLHDLGQVSSGYSLPVRVKVPDADGEICAGQASSQATC